MDPKVVVNGKEYPFVTEGDLTLGEAAEIERITGQGYDLSNAGALGLLALTYVSIKRVDPTVKLDDLRGLKGGDIDVSIDEAAPVPPTSSLGSAGNENTGNSDSSPSSDVSLVEIPEPTGTPV